MTTPLWQPSATQIAQASLTRFMRWAEQRYPISFPDYDALYQWSIQQPETFWGALWDFFGIKANTPYQSVVTWGEKIYDTHWFPGATLNFAAHLLSENSEKTALIVVNERGYRKTYTYATLREQVAYLANAFRQHGVKVGDRIAGILPNIAETVIAMLATTSLGAIWSSCSPDFGINAIVDRFSQITPKILFVTDGQYFHGKTNSIFDKLPQIIEALPSLEKTILIPYLDPSRTVDEMTTSQTRQHCLENWHDFLSRDATLSFTPIAFEDPVYILFSSGTTGVPKCIVHSAGRVLIQHLKELALHTNISTDDIVFYYTTCGWMMWNWFVSSLALSATIVLYDGSPTFPHDGILFDLIDNEKITVFGTSAKYISRLEKVKLSPISTHSLTSLRTILSTGSPLLPENFRYVYEQIKSDVCLSSISGGTDIVSCFALGNPILPVYTGELQCRGLGMAVAIFDEQGRSLQNEKGELVCTQAFPAMPIQFWQDPERKKMIDTYFSRFPNIWTHGDYASLTPTGGLIIYGRSDAILNPGGIRIGTAEIYRQVEKLDVVLESVAVGQQWRNDERIILFVRLKDNVVLDETLKSEIKNIIRTGASLRHVPAKIIQVTDIPRTMNGKIVELAIKNVIHGLPVRNQDALLNPESLRLFENIPELQ